MCSVCSTNLIFPVLHHPSNNSLYYGFLSLQFSKLSYCFLPLGAQIIFPVSCSQIHLGKDVKTKCRTHTKQKFLLKKLIALRSILNNKTNYSFILFCDCNLSYKVIDMWEARRAEIRLIVGLFGFTFLFL